MEERWGFLRPWCGALRGLLTYNTPTSEYLLWYPSQRVLQVLVFDYLDGFSIDPADFYDGANEIQLIRESLALLAAVEHVDYDAWRYLLEKHCEVYLAEEGDKIYEDKIPVRFELILDARVERDAFDTHELDYHKKIAYEALMVFCGVSQRKKVSQAYLTCLSKIAALNTRPPQEDSGVEIKVPVYMNFCNGFAQMSEFVDCFRVDGAIKEQWTGYSEQPLAAGAMRCSLKLEPMIVNCLDCNVSDLDVFRGLLALMRDDVHVAHLDLDVNMETTAARRRVEQDCGARPPSNFATSSVGLPSASLGSTVARPGLGDGVFRDRSHPFNPEPRNIAAVLGSGAVQHCSGALVEVDRLRAILQASTDQLSSGGAVYFRLIGTIREEDIEDFVAVLDAEHPEEHIFGTARGKVDEREATISANAPIRWRLVDSSELVAEFKHYLPFRGVCTFSDDGESEWVDVLVPGYGRCKVQRSNLEFTGRANAVDSSSASGIRSLSLSFDEGTVADSSGFPRFLAAIGPQLKYLTIGKGKAEFDDNIILQCCPHLEELVLYEGVVDIRLNFSECHKRKRKLPTLTYNWTDLAASLAEFGDSSNPLSTCLRKLRVLLYVFTLQDRTSDNYRCRPEEDVKALLRLLETNRTLEYLEVVAPPEYFTYLDAFRKFHLQPTRVPRKTLPRESKAAFLSLVGVRQEVSEERIKKLKQGSPRSNAPSASWTSSCSAKFSGLRLIQ